MTDRDRTPDGEAPEPGDAGDEAELSADERAILARWQPPAPPAGFADRVLEGVRAPAPARRPSRGRWLGAAVLAAAAAATTALAWPRGSSEPAAAVAAAAPRRIAAAREAVQLGGRGVAVVEPGAALSWQQVGGAAVVGQDAGDVFYRVDPGGPFTVVTPVGQVMVTGTCFRVEIFMSPIKQSILSGALGAAVATAAVVTVYEGKVVVVGDGGAQVAAGPGERLTLESGARPVVIAAGAPGPGPGPAGGPTTVALALPAPPTDDTPREELIRRDKFQREQLAMLAQRVQELERGGGPGKRRQGGLDDDASWVEPTREQLAEYAKNCRVRIDLPPIMRGDPMKVPPEWARQVGLSEAEVALTNQVFVDMSVDWTRRVRGWYVEATGDATGGDTLSAHAMGQELQDKATPGEPESLQKRISHERAGLTAPPADLAKTSPYERYFRAMAGLGEEAERLLAEKIGPDKAHALRTYEGGWPMRMDIGGCNDGDGNVLAP